MGLYGNIIFAYDNLIAVGGVDMSSNEFFDYDRQVELEAFSAPTVYDILRQQAKDVTRGLGKQKEEVRNII